MHRSPAAHTHVCMLLLLLLCIYGSPIHHVGCCCCCCCYYCLLLPLGSMMLHPRAYVFYYVPAYYSIICRYSGSTSSSRRVVAGGGGWRRRRRRRLVWCAGLNCIYTICIMYNIHVWRVCGVGLGGRASELQRTSGGHRIKCALRNRSLCLLQQQHGGKVCACLPCTPACCSCGSKRAAAAAGRHVFRPVHL